MTLPDLFAPSGLLACRDVEALIDFSGGDPRNVSMARLQIEGVTALYNILCQQRFAYLADEVGTGKTYQALGLAALTWYLKPDARVLFITPRENVQNGWLQEYRRFFRHNYLRGAGSDDRVGALVSGNPIYAPVQVGNLREWLAILYRSLQCAAILRHTSFMRPLYVPSHRNLREIWDDCLAQLRALGVHDLSHTLPTRNHTEASLAFNCAFADGVNRLLANQGIDFDLVVVDEAQCLRHSDNQTNQVFYRIFKGRVRKWLFMSATPAHSGIDNLPNVLNHYPQAGTVIPRELVHDLPGLQQRLEDFLVRRPRTYVVDGRHLVKADYRKDRQDEWAEASTQALPALAMGLVQKRLIPVLAERNYRYHIGFLSSFESLQASVRRFEARTASRTSSERRATSIQESEDTEEAKGDFYIEPSAKPPEDHAPDSGFIERLASTFERKFGFQLPHPKLDRVVRELSRLAFGECNPGEPGREKTLVFTRRISTVDALRYRLEQEFHRHLKERVRRCWRRELDWNTGLGDVEQDETVIEEQESIPETTAEPGDRSLLRLAMQEGNWLGHFRRTFYSTGRNALFFEENWLARLCRAGGTDPLTVAAQFPAWLWVESWAYAAKASHGKFTVNRVKRLHYLALHGVLCESARFGLTPAQAKVWGKLLLHILPKEAATRVSGNQSDPTRPDPDLFRARTLWSGWEERFPDGPLALPGNEPHPKPDALYRRQVLKTILGQTMRLTDTLLDLRCAELSGEPVDSFLQWLASDDQDAVRLRERFANWIAHLELILSSGLGETEPLSTLAACTHFEQLNSLAPVVGITGGSGGNRRATQQFRTPGYPLVIVCTDTLKEGVNLHLFCDRVVHYGLAWTSGDLEQRVGRVDRYFSLIERRLQRAGGVGPCLDIYYPHLTNSLERDQVVRVLVRKREADCVMDSPLASGVREARAIALESPIEEESRPLPELIRFTGERHIRAAGDGAGLLA